jgi:flavin reductase (DIM6/NTAB) family NADH-FMN oxidoreductase RutF
MKIDFNELDSKEVYKVMSNEIIPRPIAWIVTQNEEGVTNLAPFSYFAPLSSNPPSVIVSIGHKADGLPKDTLLNIRTSKKCTICMVDKKHLKKMHYSSKALDGASEAEQFDIKLETKFEEYPPMVEDTSRVFFCDFLKEIDLEGTSTIPLILEIKKAYIDKKHDDEPICRIGKSYAKIGEPIEAPEIP